MFELIFVKRRQTATRKCKPVRAFWELAVIEAGKFQGSWRNVLQVVQEQNWGRVVAALTAKSTKVVDETFLGVGGWGGWVWVVLG